MATIQVRIDSDLKESAEELFDEIGIDTATAIRLFLKQCVNHNSIPFALSATDGFYNKHNIARIKKAVDDLDAGKGVSHELLEVEHE